MPVKTRNETVAEMQKVYERMSDTGHRGVVAMGASYDRAKHDLIEELQRLGWKSPEKLNLLSNEMRGVADRVWDSKNRKGAR